MFGRSRKSKGDANPRNTTKGPMAWDVPVFFGLLFVLSIAEMCFTIDSFIYLQRKHKWWSGTERARMGFLIFSSARTVLLSGVYMGFHVCVKYLHSSLHTIFLVVSTILWVVSGVLIHQMYGYFECQNNGVADSFSEFEGQLMGGLSECHEMKIIQILAWTIAAVSIVATIWVVITRFRNRKGKKHQQKNQLSG